MCIYKIRLFLLLFDILENRPICCLGVRQENCSRFHKYLSVIYEATAREMLV